MDDLLYESTKLNNIYIYSNCIQFEFTRGSWNIHHKCNITHTHNQNTTTEFKMSKIFEIREMRFWTKIPSF